MQLNRITQANTLRGSQAQERTRLAATIAASVEEQRTISIRQAESRTVATHSELSPIRFAAHAFNWGDEEAVQLMILMLMLAFDPLGLVLVAIGSDHKASKEKQPKKRAVKVQRSKQKNRPAKVGSMLVQAHLARWAWTPRLRRRTMTTWSSCVLARRKRTRGQGTPIAQAVGVFL